jgi:hypothetical protein
MFAVMNFFRWNKEVKLHTVALHIAVALVSPLFSFCAPQAQQLPTPAPAAQVSPALASVPAEVTPTPVTPAEATPVSATAAPVTPEDWDRLPVDVTNFNVIVPAVGGEDGNDKFYRELVQLQWRTGDPVEVYVVRPKGVANPPVILYLYGYNETLDRFKNDRFCERLVAGGYAAVSFEPALGIDRFRSRPMKQWFVSELQESLGRSVHDVQMVLNYLDQRKDLDLSHVGIFGQGPGGTIAILAAAADPRLIAVDTLNPWGDWSDWLAKSAIIPEAERPFFLKPEFLDKVKPLEPTDWLPKVKASALRLQFVTGTPNVPEPAMEHMESAATHDTATLHYTIARYKDAQDMMHQNQDGKLYDWMKSRLRKSDAGVRTKTSLPPGKKSTAHSSGNN